MQGNRRINKVRKQDQGFTLIEMIVVLVIMATLAAIMVPSMVGWIDRAKEKQVLIQARNVYMAAQTIVLEDYADGETLDELTTEQMVEAEELSRCNGVIVSGVIDEDSGVIIDFLYEEGDYSASYHGETSVDSSQREGSEFGWTVWKN
ncbi:MAG: type II secretion system protein [Lachnospiraceae bacterium]|nr:type II secretion system protein [Lachnospiraceae bacterium]